jgi:hypothetical protein
MGSWDERGVERGWDWRAMTIVVCHMKSENEPENRTVLEAPGVREIVDWSESRTVSPDLTFPHEALSS